MAVELSIWDWIWAYIVGSIPIPDDYEPQPGDEIATKIGIVNTGVLSIDDDEILGEMDAISDVEFRDKIHAETGIWASMIDRRGKVILPGDEWEYKYTYNIEETPGTPGIILVAVAICAVCIAIIGVLWAIDTYVASNMKIVTPWGEVNLFPLIAGGIILLIIIIIFREAMRGD